MRLLTVGVLSLTTSYAAGFFGTDAAVGQGRSLAPVVVVPGPQASTEQYAREFAKVMQIPLSDAQAALDNNHRILDSIALNERSPSFGGIWVTYRPYQIHVRLVRKDEPLSQAIRARLVTAPAVQYGGLSGEELKSRAQTIVTAAAGSGVLAEVIQDSVNGKVVVKTDAASFAQSFIDPFVSLDGRKPEITPPTTAYGGLPLYVNIVGLGWQRYCMGGFMMVNHSTGQTGVITAGHCPNYVNQWYNAETAKAPVQESCTGTDQQIHPLVNAQGGSSTPTNWTFFSSGPGPSSAVVVEAVGGGLYIGQPVWQARQDNGDQASNPSPGTITQYSSLNIGAGGDCAGHTLNTGFRITQQTIDGDSGGSVATLYNGHWFALGITAGGNNTGSSINPVWNVSLGSWAYCTLNAC